MPIAKEPKQKTKNVLARDHANLFCIFPFYYMHCSTPEALVAQMVKNRPAMQETWVLPLGQEDPLEKEMATHSSILAWRIPRTEEPSGLQPMRSQSRTRLSDSY